MIKFGSSNRNMHASMVGVCVRESVARLDSIRTLFIHLGAHGFIHNIHIIVRLLTRRGNNDKLVNAS